MEQDELRTIYTKSLTQDTLALTTRNRGSSSNIPFELALNFNTAGDITVAAPASASYTVTGNGKFVKKGDMWGNEKRDVMYLKYQVNLGTTLITLLIQWSFGTGAWPLKHLRLLFIKSGAIFIVKIPAI